MFYLGFPLVFFCFQSNIRRHNQKQIQTIYAFHLVFQSISFPYIQQTTSLLHIPERATDQKRSSCFICNSYFIADPVVKGSTYKTENFRILVYSPAYFCLGTTISSVFWFLYRILQQSFMFTMFIFCGYKYYIDIWFKIF